MALFSKLLKIFDKNKAHKDLQDAYSKLNELASTLHNELKIFREIQKQIVERRIGKGRATGGIGLEKTLFIEESLNKQLKELAEQAEKRFLKAEEEIEKSEPISEKEKDLLEMIIRFLERIREVLPEEGTINKISSNKEKLLIVETALQSVTKLGKELHWVNQLVKVLPRKIEEHEVSILLKRIYTSPERLPEDTSFLFYKVTEKELRALEEESRRINACQDPNYKIEWRRWWRDVQIPEKDKTTPLKDPHINVTIKLFDGPKKDIHLLLKAA